MNLVRRRMTNPAGTAMVASLLAAMTPTGAAAQTGSSTPMVLDDITVTARKRPERLWDVPFSVDVRTTTQLERNRAIDAGSVLRDIGGVSFGTFGDRTNAFLVLRGVGPVYNPLSPDDSSVITFVDGVPLSIAASASAYLDLARIEVLKGPQSTLFGRNTTGGAINLIPVLPGHVANGFARGEYGTGNTYRLEGAVGGPLVPDVLAGRIAFRASGAGGYIRNTAGPDLGRDRNIAGRGSLLFTPSERLSWLISFSGEHANDVPVQYSLHAPGFPRLAAQNLAKDKRTITVANSKLEYAFDGAVLTAQTSLSTFRSSVPFNIGDFFISSRQLGLPPDAFADPATNYGRPKRDETRFTQEVRLSSTAGSAVAWLLGGVYYRDRSKQDFPRNFWPYGAAQSGDHTYRNVTTGQALFGELTYPLWDRLKLSVGGRLAHEKKDFRGTFTSDGTPGALPFFAESGKLRDTFWTGRMALSYEWSEQFVSFASVSRGYKTGGFGNDNSLDWAGVPRVPYRPSTILTYEIGGRAHLLDRKLALQGALFFNDMKKAQMMTWDYTSFTMQALNVDARSAGFELDARYQVTPNWDIAGGVAYTHSRLRNVSADLAAAQPGLRNGNQLSFVPAWTMKASLGYSKPASEMGIGGRLASATFFGNVRYNLIGKRYTDPANAGRVEPSHIVSARLGMSWDHGEVYLFGDNLLGKKYVTVNQPYGPAGDGSPLFGASYARGMTVGVGMALKF